MSRFLLLSLVIAGCWGDYSCAAEPAPDFAAWVRGLGDERFTERELCSQRLLEAGSAAVPSLIAGVRWGDFETCVRSLAILENLSLLGEEPVPTLVWEQLTTLANELDAPRRDVVVEALASLRQRQLTYTVQTLESLGAVIHRGPRQVTVELGKNWKGTCEQLRLLTRLEQVTSLVCENSSVNDAALAAIGELKSLRRLSLSDSPIHGPGLCHLSKLEHLQSLSLKNLPITDDHLAALSSLKSLTECVLSGIEISNAGLNHLVPLEKLQFLGLEQTRITHAGLLVLAKLPNLTRLNLIQADVSGEGLRSLAELPQLTTLSLKGVQLSVDDMARLSACEQLDSLGLDHTSVTNEHLAQLAGLPKLRILWLSRTKVSDEAIPHLARFQSLQTLYLHGAEVSERGVEQLKKLLPHCQAYR